jgi:hypothetical protein
MPVHTENFLNDDDAAARRSDRIGAIGAELMAVGGSEREFTSHGPSVLDFDPGNPITQDRPGSAQHHYAQENLSAAAMAAAALVTSE